MTDGQHQHLERATESTFARYFARYAMPAMLAIVVWLGGIVLTDIRAAVNDIDNRTLTQGAQIQQLDSGMQLLNSKIDNGLLWRIGELERRLDDMERAGAAR